MKLFKKKDQKTEKLALEQLVKDNFCKAKGIVGCSYYQKTWCPKTCGFYERARHQAKYWNK